MSKRLFFITANNSWSGSEELWTRSAKDFLNKGYLVSFATKYEHGELLKLNAKHYIFSKRFTKSLLKKVVEKLLKIKFKSNDIISDVLKKEKPELVILSQGNNIDDDGIRECCYNVGIPYITIINLVTEVHFLSINADNLYSLQQGYLKARKNYFVSQKNLRLNNLMLGIEPSNAEVIYCPSIIKKDDIPSYPQIDNYYKIGLVGRIECFHKGYDLLLELASMKKWRERAIHFNVYGDGPHKELLSQNIARLKLKILPLKAIKKYRCMARESYSFMPSRMEGVALTLIEAIHCSRSAIVTDVGDAALLIEDGINGFVADSATVSSLDEALERAWNKRDIWKELGIKAAKTLKEKYSENAVEYFNEKVVAELAKIYERH